MNHKARTFGFVNDDGCKKKIPKLTKKMYWQYDQLITLMKRISNINNYNVRLRIAQYISVYLIVYIYLVCKYCVFVLTMLLKNSKCK